MRHLPLLGLLCLGCAAPRPWPGFDPHVARAARPILTLDPDADWTAAFNQLIALGPRSVTHLAESPTLTTPCAPDDLAAFVHLSLLARLAPVQTAPSLTATCLQVSNNLLHFDIRVDHETLGPSCQTTPTPPRYWHALYPADFDHDAGDRIHVNQLRQHVRRWYETRRRGQRLVRAAPLRPNPDRLFWRLPHRYADIWTYRAPQQPRPSQAAPETTPLFDHQTYDYNVVRAACIHLGRHPDLTVRGRLIELLAQFNTIAAYNARFALRYAPDPRIQQLLEQFEQQLPPAPTPTDRLRVRREPTPDNRSPSLLAPT